jgi:hypothetical protein
MSSRRTSRKKHSSGPEFWKIENELPDPIPISTAELDSIERYFGSVLDAVFDSRPHAQLMVAPGIKKEKSDDNTVL